MSVKFKYPIVKIVWDDAESDAAWSEVPTRPLGPTLATTLGFLIVDEPEWVLVCDTYFDGSRVIGNTNKIPRGMIKEFEYLVASKPRKKNANAKKPGKTPEEVLDSPS